MLRIISVLLLTFSYSLGFSAIQLELGQDKIVSYQFDQQDLTFALVRNGEATNDIQVKYESHSLNFHFKESHNSLIGKYTLVIRSATGIVEDEIDVNVSSPQPFIAGIHAQGSQHVIEIEQNKFILKWNNAVHEVQLKINGDNFIFSEDPDNMPEKPYLIWTEEDPKIKKEIVSSKKDELAIKFVLSNLTRSGSFKFKLVNYDGSESDEYTLVVQPEVKPSFTRPSLTNVILGSEQKIEITGRYLYQVEKFEFVEDAGTGSSLVIENRDDEGKRFDLKMLYTRHLGDIVYKLYDSDDRYPFFPGQTIFLGQDNNKCSFGKITDYEKEIVDRGTRFAIPGNPNIGPQDLTFYNADSTQSLDCKYIVESIGGSFSHYIQLEEDIVIEDSISGEYVAIAGNWKIKGAIEALSVPEIEFVKWIPVDDRVLEKFGEHLYATGKDQSYNVRFTFQDDFRPGTDELSVFEAKLKIKRDNIGNGDYQVVVPSSVKAGDIPKFYYRDSVEIKIENLPEKVRSYNEPVEDTGFVMIFPRNDHEFIDFYSIDKEVVSVIRGSASDKVRICVNNREEYGKGRQKFKVVFTLRNDNLEVKGNDKEKVNSVKEFSVDLQPGDVFEDSISFKIGKWNSIEVRLVYDKRDYSIINEDFTDVKAFRMLYGNKSSTKLVGLLAIPTSLIAVRDINAERWVIAPFNFSGGIGLDWVEEDGAWTGYNLGLQLGLSQLNRLVSDEQYFGSMLMATFTFDILKINDVNYSLPISIGGGVLSEWRNNVCYVNPLFTASIQFDISGNRN